MSASQLPKLPAAHNELASYIAKHPNVPMKELMEPYRKFEAKLREMYAQERSNPVLEDPYLNVLPLLTKDTPSIQTRARNLDNESQEQKDKYIMPLPDDKRRPDGSAAVVESLKEFRHNFGVFSESSLSDLNWDNVVAAGSSVVNTLLPVPPEYKKSKRALREYYHEKFCPASDVDLFLYGLNEEQVIEKIKDIEASIRDAILSEVTVVRTKNAITICSQYPTRHIQIVLRVYKSVSEILTGFDIDCSGAAYDGNQVYTTPRALASYITQINPIDLSRRSPSYENRLSKYSHRNFEVYWPELDRSRVDPTIFERSFQRTLGLARLLVLERLPTANAREQYMKKRREERGRPQAPQRFQHRLFGNIKDIHEDEVADWVDETEVSNYHTFTVPYGVKFHAKKIEKLCYTKDLLLNAEWNQPKEREVYLHRHPAFFGRVEDVIGDCCGTCPKAQTPEEIEIAEKESEIYVSGNVSFRIDDPGRQQIGSFNPLTEDDWTEMAYVGNTARLCQAIVDKDLEHVEDWLSQEGADPNTRDYTGRTPLHLAVISSTPAIVKCLVDHGARLVARIADGRTALHLAAGRGNIEMVKILLEKSNANEEEEEEKVDQRRKARQEKAKVDTGYAPRDSGLSDGDISMDDGSDGELVDDESSDDGVQSIATGSFVKVDNKDEPKSAETIPLDDDQNDPDFYKIDAIAWDSKCSPLHLAIIGGHCEMVKLLCQEFGADALLPVKLGDGSYEHPHAAILTLVLALALPLEQAVHMCETLLSLGATSSQADLTGVTAFHRYIRNNNMKAIDCLWEHDKLGLKTAINHIAVSGSDWNMNATSPLMTAIDQNNPILVLKLLDAGAKPELDFDSWLQGAKFSSDITLGDFERNQTKFSESMEQPLITAIRSGHPELALELLERGVDPSPVTKASWEVIKNEWARRWRVGETALDVVRHLLKELRKYNGEPVTPRLRMNSFGFNNLRGGRSTTSCAPEAPSGTEEFLSRFSEGTYQHWLVSNDIKRKMEDYKHDLEAVAKEKKRIASLKGLVEKKEAIQNLISQLEKVEAALVEKRAKTFKELHPKIECMENPQPDEYEDTSRGDYSLKFSFTGVKDLTSTRETAYIELFEAAWTGNIDKIKSLALAPWGPEAKEPPLKVAVSDLAGNNPFSLAFLKGHFDTARAILEIVQAQWSPPDKEKSRYKIVDANEDEESYEDSEASDSGSEPEVRMEIIKDQFTIDNIGQVSMQVKSDVLPSAILDWKVPTFVLGGDKVEDAVLSTQTLLAFSMFQEDSQRFNLLLDLHNQFVRKSEDEDDSSKFYAFPKDDFEYAIQTGRINMLAEAIRRTGAGIPLEELVKKSGTEMKVKPRYYQGLTVYGKKRADWAAAGRNLVVKPTGTQAPPLLTAALKGSIESVEWFLGDAPMRHYREFGTSSIAKEDQRLKHLNESSGGFDRAIAKWLGIQNDYVIHCAVLGPIGDRTNRLIEYLIKVCPASFEAKSDLGYTPLFLACLMGRPQFAKTLIDAGADQSVKDGGFNNIVHACVINYPDLDLLRQMLDLFDPELRTHMFRQRNNLSCGGNTPLHLWLTESYIPWSRLNGDKDSTHVTLLRLLLEYSKGEELEILNGSGDTVLHTAVLRSSADQARVLLEQNPKLLFRENTVGRTPGEIAYDLYTNDKVKEPDSVAINVRSYDHLVDQNPEEFLPKAKDKKTNKEQTWEVVQEYLAKTEGKRRLVSLNEANDVARRLGEKYLWQRYYTKTTNQNNEDDDHDANDDAKKTKEPEPDFVNVNYKSERDQAWYVEKEKVPGADL
ncbi:ankyrin repeat protein [Xylaria bambusicola]|uniref:ankyrin repeat protein n=1 Tax=Xylaria bambusicola TaxID=326684 RepID=UPI0020079549|nr:ankyrin repeat protein [Xylaria bambusicola]KAI0521370.1 ankyrin repeat protein [Xylaria bambusicola]